MSGSRPNTLEEYKIKASILLKSLKSHDAEKGLGAAGRFRRLVHLAKLSSQEIVQQNDQVKRKHALAVIALENNRTSWADLKQFLEKRDSIREMREYTPLYPQRCEGIFNEWYASYETARSHRDETGGYLLPYKNHYFICHREYVKSVGFDPDDPDWERIGWDWVRPADREAWNRLNARLGQIEAERDC